MKAEDLFSLAERNAKMRTRYGHHGPVFPVVPANFSGESYAECKMCGTAWPCRAALELGLRLVRDYHCDPEQIAAIVGELLGDQGR